MPHLPHSHCVSLLLHLSPQPDGGGAACCTRARRRPAPVFVCARRCAATQTCVQGTSSGPSSGYCNLMWEFGTVVVPLLRAVVVFVCGNLTNRHRLLVPSLRVAGQCTACASKGASRLRSPLVSASSMSHLIRVLTPFSKSAAHLQTLPHGQATTATRAVRSRTAGGVTRPNRAWTCRTRRRPTARCHTRVRACRTSHARHASTKAASTPTTRTFAAPRVCSACVSPLIAPTLLPHCVVVVVIVFVYVGFAQQLLPVVWWPVYCGVDAVSVPVGALVLGSQRVHAAGGRLRRLLCRRL